MASPSNGLLFSHEGEEEALHVLICVEQAPRNTAKQTKRIKNGEQTGLAHV